MTNNTAWFIVNIYCTTVHCALSITYHCTSHLALCVVDTTRRGGPTCEVWVEQQEQRAEEGSTEPQTEHVSDTSAAYRSGPEPVVVEYTAWRGE